MTLGEILDQAIRLYRRNFVRFIGILAIPYIPLTIIQTFLSYLSTNALTNYQPSPSASPLSMFPSSYWTGLLGMFVVGFLEFILVNGLAGAALTRAVADSYTGQSTDIIGSYAKIGSSWTRLLGALILFWIISIVVGIAAFLIPIVGWFFLLGLFVFLNIVVGPLLAPVVILERQDSGSSLRRAWDLSRSRFWWLLGFAIVLSLLAQLLISGPTYLAVILLQSVFAGQANYMEMLVWRTVIQVLVQMLGGLLYLPLQLSAMTVVYFDLRVRTEGLDLAMQAAANAGTETNIVALTETSPKPSSNLMNGTDVGQMILLSLAVIALFVILFGIIFAVSLAVVYGLQ